MPYTGFDPEPTQLKAECHTGGHVKYVKLPPTEVGRRFYEGRPSNRTEEAKLIRTYITHLAIFIHSARAKMFELSLTDSSVSKETSAHVELCIHRQITYIPNF
ncbi:hypothetical protein TNCV_4378031 [Trichonephila clavipes]|nr:hypothetical protein TNCV_4378031 [Trichonephila clavipes]